MLERIQALMDAQIRPQLRQHGGEAEIVSYENGVLRLRLLGACAGCPAAQLTNESLIEAVLKEQLPEVQEVQLVQQVSESLLEEARRLMKNGGKR